MHFQDNQEHFEILNYAASLKILYIYDKYGIHHPTFYIHVKSEKG